MKNTSEHIDNQVIEDQNTILKQENNQLKDRIKWLEKQLFGQKAERVAVASNSSQGSLFDDSTIEDNQQESVTVPTHKRKKRKKEENRKPLPSHLERVEEYIEADFDTTGMVKIGEERTEVLERLPAKLYVRVLIRSKYADGEQVKIVNLPELPIPQGNAGASLIAHILTAKYLEHMPLYRLSKRFERESIRIAPSTLSDWVGYAADNWLFILYKRMMGMVLDSGYIQADETPIKVLDKLKKGKSHRGYFWVYYSPEHRLVFFDYQKGRSREGPREILNGYQGYLQSDGYVAYDEFDTKAYPDITLLHCMAHARRKFHEALSNDKARAEHVLDLMGKLYGIEKELRSFKTDMDASQWHQKRQQVRQKQSTPILEQLGKWLLEEAGKVLPKSSIGKAINYSLSRWKTLCRYTEDGKVEIDNNLVENQIRPVALGRKNFLFAGSHQGAIRAAVIYSLVGTCQKEGIDPEKYFTDVLTKLPTRKANDIDDLLPQNWNSKNEADSA